MHLRIFVASLVLACGAGCVPAGLAAQSSGAPGCANLQVVPAPRECTAVVTVKLGAAGVAVTADRNADDAFASKDLEESVKALGTVVSAQGVPLRLLRAETPSGKELLTHHGLKLEAEQHDEGYVIVPDGKGLAVIAETSAGLFYGAQTVKQLVRGSGKDAVLLAPTIRDWPALPHRGLSDDWSRGPLPTMEFLKREIRTLAAYKYNIFSPYFEHTFAYASTPVAAFPGGAMTPDEAKELVAYAAQYHITIIPEQEAFGHLHHVLKFETYSHLGETPHGAVLAPGDAATLPQIGEWFAELAKVFPGPYAHIGADETFELGLGRTRGDVQQQGLGKVYLDFLGKIHEQLKPTGKQLLFWGDVAENSPELVGTLPKDMIAVSWHYDAAPSFEKNLEPFLKSGLETWVAPGVNNWNRVYPNNNEALGNIRAFVRDGQKMGAKGMLNTVWNDDGDAIFDENWFGVVFGGAAAWQPGESSEAAYTASFGQAFHGDPTGKISQAHQALMAAHALLRKADLYDAQNAYFWIDPFSPEGKQVAVKLLPVASELRLDAEKAITLLAEARAAAKKDGRKLENEEALDALELGARRIDFIGYKFQAADDCVKAYAEAQRLAATDDKTKWEEVAAQLETVASNNGRMQDIRDGYALLGQLYKEAWLRDNRPYWLAVDEARFDSATQLWNARGTAWEISLRVWWDTHKLVQPADASLLAAQ
ncbi:MAG: family 20 glycosylhydrolase [Terracidiphilus sp.]|nr:family 20 glycosylhydrolase [Terracidiphilus sp.]